jgi:hypothetical protein
MRSTLIILLFSSLVCAGQNTPAHTNNILQQATEIAKAENKNVLVVFTASWCYWCGKMKQSLEDAVCKNIFSKYYTIRYLVVHESENKKYLENPGADSLKSKHGGEGLGIPYWLVLDKAGGLLVDSRMLNKEKGETENSGCPATEKEVGYFIEVLQKSSAASKEELEIIRKRFRENEK